MLLIQQVTSDPSQSQTLLLPSGESVELEIRFVPMQLAWFITRISYLNFEAKNIRITNNFNILRQFKNLIPFGLACISTGGREPSLQEDFSSAQSRLYILDESEVIYFEDKLSGKV